MAAEQKLQEIFNDAKDEKLQLDNEISSLKVYLQLKIILIAMFAN